MLMILLVLRLITIPCLYSRGNRGPKEWGSQVTTWLDRVLLSMLHTCSSLHVDRCSSPPSLGPPYFPSKPAAALRFAPPRQSPPRRRRAGGNAHPRCFKEAVWKHSRRAVFLCAVDGSLQLFVSVSCFSSSFFSSSFKQIFFHCF